MKPAQLFALLRLLCLAVLMTGALPAQAQSTCQSRVFNGHEDRVSAAYIAYYGRPADTGGLAYWAGQLAARGGDLGAIIDAFGNSAEYRQRFGSLSNRELIRNLYQQLYGRDPDMAGWAFYEMWLNTGVQSLASIAISIMDGTEGGDTAILDNRKTVARHFITRMEALGAAAPAITDGSLLADLMAATDGSAASRENACAQVNTLIEAQSTTTTVLTMAAHEAGASGAINNLSGAVGSERYFKLMVPAGVTDLVIRTARTAGGMGDVDLYVSRGVRPAPGNADCSSGAWFSADEQCSFATPVAGEYFILLRGAIVDYSGVTLSASWQGHGSVIVQPKLVDGIVFTEKLPLLVDFSIKDNQAGLGQLVFGAGTLLPDGWKNNSIVYIEPNSDFPQGQFFRINNITQSSAGNRVDVSTPALDEIFSDLEISLDRLTDGYHSIQILQNPQMTAEPVLRMRSDDGSIKKIQPSSNASGEWFPDLNANLKLDIIFNPGSKLDGVKFTLDGLTIWKNDNGPNGTKEKASYTGSYEIKDLQIKNNLNISNGIVKGDLDLKYTTVDSSELAIDISSGASAKDEEHRGFEASCGGKVKKLGLEISGAKWEGDVCLGGLRITPTPPSVLALVGNKSIPVPFSVDLFFFVGADLKVEAQANFKKIEESVVEYKLAIDTTKSSDQALYFGSQSYDGIHFKKTGEKIPPKSNISASGKIDGSAQVRGGLAVGIQAGGIYPIVARGYGYAKFYIAGEAELYPGFGGIDGGECYKAGIAAGPGFTANFGLSAKFALNPLNWGKRTIGGGIYYDFKKEFEVFKDEFGNCIPLDWSLQFNAGSDKNKVLVDSLTIKYKDITTNPTRVEYELRKLNGSRYDLHAHAIRDDASPITFPDVPAGDYVIKVSTTTLGMQTIGYRGVSVAPTAALNLNATPGDGYIDLSWNAIPEATEYMLHMAAGVGGPDGLPSIGTTTANQYRVSGLQNGTLYRFTARAFKGSEVIAGSGLVSATPVGGQLIAGRYLTIEGGAVIRDTVNKLEWQRCSVGQTWNGASQRCDGEAVDYTWNDAITQTAAGGFRIPYAEELKTLVYCSSGRPVLFGPSLETGCWPSYVSPALVVEAFPLPTKSNLAWLYWSGSMHPDSSRSAWYVNYATGASYGLGHGYARFVRLVRLVQSSASSSSGSTISALVRASSTSQIPSAPPATAITNLVGHDGAPPNAVLHSVRLEASGRGTYFLSRATNLVPGVNNGAQHLFHFDAATGQIKNLAASTSGAPGDGDITAFDVALQAGKLVFRTKATNLESGPGLYLLDLETGTRRPLLTALQHGGSDPGADNPVLGTTGQGLAFDAPDAAGRLQVFTAGLGESGLHDLRQETPIDGQSIEACCAALSGDGRYLAWQEVGHDDRVLARVLDLASDKSVTIDWPQEAATGQVLRLALSENGALLHWLAVPDTAENAAPLHGVANPLFVPTERLH